MSLGICAVSPEPFGLAHTHTKEQEQVVLWHIKVNGHTAYKVYGGSVVELKIHWEV